MKGPRTNQFVAPTSFITSISRLREKIESRIVFAIRSADETRRMIVAIEERSRETRATVTTRAETSPPSLIFSTPGGSVGVRRLWLIALMSLPSMRRDLERVRERVAGQVLDDLRLQLAHALERLGLGDEVDALDQRVGGRASPGRR